MAPIDRLHCKRLHNSRPQRTRWHLFAPLTGLVLGVALSTPASAQLFVCTDARGRTISGDRPPPECAERPVRELRSDGSVKRVIEPPPSAEQKAARDAEEKRRREDAEKHRVSMRKDLALLDAYASEAEIETVRQRALASRQVMIERSLQRLEEHTREKKKLDSEAEFYTKRPMPDSLKRQFETNASLIRSEERIIRDVRADMERINERYDGEKKRWRELVDSGATPRVDTPEK